MHQAIDKLQKSRELLKIQRAEENNATAARRKSNRDKWDEETAGIKRVLLAEEKPLLTDNQKLTLKHVKTYLLENGKGFLCPSVKKDTVVQVWNCAFPDKS